MKLIEKDNLTDKLTQALVENSTKKNTKTLNESEYTNDVQDIIEFYDEAELGVENFIKDFSHYIDKNTLTKAIHEMAEECREYMEG